jgi:hypothetical protein
MNMSWGGRIHQQQVCLCVGAHGPSPSGRCFHDVHLQVRLTVLLHGEEKSSPADTVLDEACWVIGIESIVANLAWWTW